MYFKVSILDFYKFRLTSPPKLSILPLWCFCPLPAYVHYGQFHLDTNRGRLIIKSALPLMG